MAVLVKFLEVKGESKVSNGAKPRITQDTLKTFIILGPKGLMVCGWGS